MRKIHVIDTFAIPAVAYGVLKKLGHVEIHTDLIHDSHIILQRIADAEVIVVNKTPLTANIINKLTRTKLIVVSASGYDCVDIKAATQKNIKVCNAPGYSTTSVAEHVFTLILILSRKIKQCLQVVEKGRWLEESLMGTELNNKKIGIVGFGAIGQQVAKIAEAFSMQVLAYTQHPDKYRKDFPEIQFVELPELMRTSNIVTLHIPYTAATDKIVNGEMLNLMHPGSILINTARGNVIDSRALLARVQANNIYAGIDVLPQEGIVSEIDKKLVKNPNIIVTPHTAWHTKEAINRLMRMVYDNIAGFYDGSPINTVN